MAGVLIQEMRDLTTTNGRVSRSTFWWFHIFILVVFLFMSFIGRHKVLPEWFAGIILLLLLLMRIIVEIKRWHDRNKSGWCFLIGFIPCVGLLWVLVECGFLPGTKGKNRFGPDPLTAIR